MKKRTGLLVCLCVLLALLCACGKAGASWQEQYDLGVRYLSEGNYQEAITAFEAAIEIDPNRAEAYAQLAEVYLAMEDPESARSALEQGVAATEDEGLRARVEELSAPPGLEGVWVCEGSYGWIRLTVDAEGHCFGESCLNGEEENQTMEVDLRLCGMEERGSIGRTDSEGRYTAVLDTTGNYLILSYPLARETPVPHGDPDPALTGTWETWTDYGLDTYTFGADGMLNMAAGEQTMQGPYIVIPSESGKRNMIIVIANGDFMANNNGIFYEIVEIDGVEHLYMCAFDQDFTEPDYDMTRAE